MKDVKKYYPNITPRYSMDGPSAYGKPDGVTLKLLNRLHGNVLEVGAGDGRYTHPMLERGLEVVAGDVDQKALDVLMKKTPENQIDHVKPVIFDAFEPFPFPDKSFDGVVSTAFLYLFPEEYIRNFMEEADRVTKTHGKVVVDFVMNRKRTDELGNEVKGEDEVQYGILSGSGALHGSVQDLFVDMESEHSYVDQDLLETAGYRMKAEKVSVLYEKPVSL
jgi:ubiquinone/menaquinone biosynthesis C-methylase UbiE